MIEPSKIITRQVCRQKMAFVVAAIMPHDLTPRRIPLSGKSRTPSFRGGSASEPGIQSGVWIPGLRQGEHPGMTPMGIGRRWCGLPLAVGCGMIKPTTKTPR
jgi:hypothetical protein